MTAADARTRAATLIEELEATLPHLEPAALLELRPGVARVGEAMVQRALGAALGVVREAEEELGLVDAAGVLGRSERWLRAHRAALRIGYQLNGAGPWRFTRRELERIREAARRRR